MNISFHMGIRKLERERDELQKQLAAERALGDRLAMFADVTAHSCPNEQIQRNAQEALNAWKEARK